MSALGRTGGPTLRLAAKRTAKRLARAATARGPLSRGLLFRGPRSRARVALTFDDGPHPEFTGPVLETLASRGARATFFVLGRQVERHPELLGAIRDAGHEIGIHGYDHTSFDLVGQARRTGDILAAHGVRARLFRPPRGSMAPATGVELVLGGYRTVLWSFDSRDSMRAEGKASGPVDYGDLGPGDIVLLHDDNRLCADELGGIISTVRSRGLGLCAVSELG